MNAAQLMEEIRLAQEEHARALAIVQQTRGKVEAARLEVEKARSAERECESDLEQAAEKLRHGLQALHVDDGGDAPPPVTARLPLPPPPPTVTDCLVEYQANIGCYHCYLRVDDGGAVDTSVMRVDVQLTKVSILLGLQTWWTVELERKVDAANCSIISKDDHIYMRFPVNESDKEATDGFSSFSQMAQRELDVANYRTLCCRSCGVVFKDETDALELEKVLPLPSENWMEMFDFWGAGIGSFEHIPREGIFAQEKRIYVGPSHIIMHENDLTDKSKLVDDISTTTSNGKVDSDEPNDWQPICCSGCHVAIGDRRTENPATLRLQKHRVRTGGADGTGAGDVFERYTIDSTVSAEMLHVAESDGIFRFLLRAPAQLPVGSHTTKDVSSLQLQLLSWDTKIQVKSATANSDFQRVLKIVYTKIQEPTTRPVQQPDDLPPMLRTHEIVVTPAIAAEITRRLEQSTLLLPPSQRCFDKRTVGYLYA